MAWFQRTFLNSITVLLCISNNSVGPTYIPQQSLTHPLTHYCSSLSLVTSGRCFSSRTVRSHLLLSHTMIFGHPPKYTKSVYYTLLECITLCQEVGRC